MARSHRRNRLLVFTSTSAEALAPRFRGGKGYSLAVAKQLGLRVPPFFTISTSAGRAFLETGRLPDRLLSQVNQWGIPHLEQEWGGTFGVDFETSVRSGAQESMPGMMATLWGVRDRSSLWTSLETTFASWNSPEAQAYRQDHSIRDDAGTAASVQVIVDGRTGATGVATSHNEHTGERGLFGECLFGQIGPDHVSGRYTPEPITALLTSFPDCYHELNRWMTILYEHAGYPVELEWTIAGGVLWALQWRKDILEPLARAKVWVSLKESGKQGRPEVVEQFTPEDLDLLRHRSSLQLDGFEPGFDYSVIAEGTVASAGCGAVVAYVARDMADVIYHQTQGWKSIYVATMTDVRDYDIMAKVDAIVTEKGGKTCHAAIVGRALGKLVVVGCGDLSWLRGHADQVSICGHTGQIYNQPLPLQEAAPECREAKLVLKWAGDAPATQVTINPDLLHYRRDLNRALTDFYVLEAMALEAEASPHTSYAHAVRDTRNTVRTELAEFMLTYLVVAVSSEIRHAWHKNTASVYDAWSKLVQLGLVGGEGRGSDYLVVPLAGRDVGDQIAFFASARRVFDAPIWHGKVGGELWGRIAEAAEMYLTGRWPMQMFVDRCFNLRHNTGSVFNKHPMAYKETSRHCLDRQLDAKRQASDVVSLRASTEQAGQISFSYLTLWRGGAMLGLWPNVVRVSRDTFDLYDEYAV